MNPAQGEKQLSNLEDCRVLAEDFVDCWPDRSIVLLYGPMGVGKTQFVRFVMNKLGCNETCSPSFALHNHYVSSSIGVDHVDLFRLESEDELESSGFWDLFSQDKAWVFIEWAERLNERDLPRNWKIWRLDFSRQDNDRRLVKWRQLTVLG